MEFRDTKKRILESVNDLVRWGHVKLPAVVAGGAA